MNKTVTDNRRISVELSTKRYQKNILFLFEGNCPCLSSVKLFLVLRIVIMRRNRAVMLSTRKSVLSPTTMGDNAGIFLFRSVSLSQRRSVSRCPWSSVRRLCWTSARNCQRRLVKQFSRRDVSGHRAESKMMILANS